MAEILTSRRAGLPHAHDVYLVDTEIRRRFKVQHPLPLPRPANLPRAYVRNRVLRAPIPEQRDSAAVIWPVTASSPLFRRYYPRLSRFVAGGIRQRETASPSVHSVSFCAMITRSRER